MKYIKHLLAIITFFSLIITVQAKDITLQDIYDNLKSEESNINSTNDIYTSQINYDNDKITITYSYKDNTYSNTYMDPELFITTISGNDIITFLTGADNFNNYYMKNLEIAEYSDLLKNLNSGKLIAIDNAWFEKLVEVLNNLTNNKFAKFNEIKNEEDYCNQTLGICYTNYKCAIIMPFYNAQFRINKNITEITNITDNSATLNIFNIAAHYSCSVREFLQIYLYTIENDRLIQITESNNNEQINITDLKPATKYTYYASTSNSKEEMSKDEFEKNYNPEEWQKIEFTTLEEPKTNDTQETNKPQVENPNTGASIPIISGIILLALSIILFKLARKNKKLF